jgi:hypothetical protein
LLRSALEVMSLNRPSHKMVPMYVNMTEYLAAISEAYPQTRH